MSGFSEDRVRVSTLELFFMELATGAALYMACEVGFRRTLWIARSHVRLGAPAATLATIPLGTELAATAQVGALAAIVAVALIVEGSRSAPAAIAH